MTFTRHSRRAVFASLLAVASPSVAAESVTYSYDARGRLVHVARSSTPSSRATTEYSYDKADNRILKTVASTIIATPARVIVVPRNGGFTVIPIP